MSRPATTGILAVGLLAAAGCGQPPAAARAALAGPPPASTTVPAPIPATTPAAIPTTVPTETVIEDPACPSAGWVAQLGRVGRVDAGPRCAEGWAVATAGAGAARVRVVLRRHGFEYAVVDVSPLDRACPVKLTGLPVGLRGLARCGR